MKLRLDGPICGMDTALVIAGDFDAVQFWCGGTIDMPRLIPCTSCTGLAGGLEDITLKFLACGISCCGDGSSITELFESTDEPFSHKASWSSVIEGFFLTRQTDTRGPCMAQTLFGGIAHAPVPFPGSSGLLWGSQITMESEG